MEAELIQLVGSPITAVGWKKDRSAVALSTSNEEIHVYEKAAGNKWTLQDTLREHDQRVTSIDWYSGPEGDKILSCSSDRNAYVWTKAGSSWKPSLVLLRFKRAATCARWTQDGTKFAVGGSEGLVAISHYDRENDWWLCKHLKKVVDGPVLALAWHPSGSALSVGTISGSLHVVTASLPEVDSGKAPSWLDPALAGTFDAECFTVKVGSWVSGVAFSPSGNTLAWSNRTGVISVYYPTSGFQSSVQCIIDGCNLPFQKLLFISENVLMAAGSSKHPILLSGADGKDWALRIELTPDQVAPKAPATGAGILGKVAKFQMMDQQGQTASQLDAKKTAPTHLSAVSSLEAFEGSNQVSKVATMGFDGRMVIWSIGKLASQYEMEAAKL